MVDGKVCNALKDNKSSSSCYICKAKPSEMNNLSKIGEKSCNQETYKFVLSTLHCRIRFMENLLKIAYRIPVRTSEDTTKKGFTEEEKNL